MKERFLHVVLTVFLSLMGLSASAYDFEADGLYYTITSTSDLTVSVSGLADPSRVELVIPNVVVYKSKSLLVTSIDEEAFANTNIESISVPSSVIKIGNKAFQECSNLKVVNLSEGISYLGSNCFSGCSHLSSIELPTTLKYVPSYTFSDCTELSQCILHENIKAIYESAFKNSGIEIINIPNSCDTIGTSAFADAANLKHVVLPSALRSISERCFSGCQKLQDLSLPQSICYINDYAFSGCISLKELQLPTSLKCLGNNVLYGDSLIKKLVIPDSVTKIGFYNYAHLKSITFGASLSGLPFWYKYYNYDISCKDYSRVYKTMQSYFQSDPLYFPGNYSLYYEDNLCNELEEVIIADSKEEFRMRAFQKVLIDQHDRHHFSEYLYPPFSNCDIKRFYVGRPLIDIKEFYCTSPHGIKGEQGKEGHIAFLEIAGECTEIPYFYQRVDTLVIGENITKFDVDNIYTDSIKAILCKCANPPGLENYSNILTSTYTDAIVYVPQGTLAVYQAADGWKNFWNIEEYDTTSTGIANISDPLPDKIIYNLQGHKLSKPQKGINIINGKKVLIK